MTETVESIAPRRGDELITWALDLAGQHLAERVPDRWSQTQAAMVMAESMAAVVAGDRDAFLASIALGNLGWDPELLKTHGYQPVAAAARMRYLGVPERLVHLHMHLMGGRADSQRRGFGAAFEDVPDEGGATRDALWYCYLAVNPGGVRVPFEQRMSDARERYAHDPVSLAVIEEILEDYADAIARTEERARALGITLP